MTDLLLGQLAAKVLVLVAVFTCGSKQNPEQSCWRFGSEQTERGKIHPDTSKLQHFIIKLILKVERSLSYL